MRNLWNVIATRALLTLLVQVTAVLQQFNFSLFVFVLFKLSGLRALLHCGLHHLQPGNSVSCWAHITVAFVYRVHLSLIIQLRKNIDAAFCFLRHLLKPFRWLNLSVQLPCGHTNTSVLWLAQRHTAHVTCNFWACSAQHLYKRQQNKASIFMSSVRWNRCWHSAGPLLRPDLTAHGDILSLLDFLLQEFPHGALFTVLLCWAV